MRNILEFNSRADRISEKLRKISLTLFVAAANVVPVFCEGDSTGISEGIYSGLEQVYNILTAVILPIGVIALAVCAIKMIWGNERSAEAGKSALIRIVIALALIFLAPLLVKTVASWFKGKSSFADIKS